MSVTRNDDTSIDAEYVRVSFEESISFAFCLEFPAVRCTSVRWTSNNSNTKSRLIAACLEFVTI